MSATIIEMPSMTLIIPTERLMQLRFEAIYANYNVDKAKYNGNHCDILRSYWEGRGVYLAG